MSELLIYLFKVNVALVLFYLFYLLVLRRLTFYYLNRLFLVFSILFSTSYPFIDVSELLSQHQELTARLYIPNANWQPTQNAPAIASSFNYEQVFLLLFWVGAILMFLRLLMQLASLYRIHALSKPASYQNIFFQRIQENINPFSFWQLIYLNPDNHEEEELLPILRHELIHLQEWHTLDVLLAEINTIFYWFNPGAWLIKGAIKQNLEFITDHKVLQSGLNTKKYQYSLIRISSLAQGTPLANNFNFITIKTRIAMMNKMPSTRAHQLKFLLVLPVVVGLVIAFNGVAQTTNSVDKKPSQTVKSKQARPDKLVPPPPAPMAPPAPAYPEVPANPPAPPAITEPVTKPSRKNSDQITIEVPIGNQIILGSKSNAGNSEATTQSPSGDPIYFLNGERISKSEFKALNPENIAQVEVYKNNTATEKFGQEAEYGAILISTKTAENSNEKDLFNNTTKDVIKIQEQPATIEKLAENRASENPIGKLSRQDKEDLLLQELRSDNLYSNDKLYTFRITNSAMYINNQEQPEALFRKYRKYLPFPNKNIPGQSFEVKGRFRVK
ncbi:M56 family metallopeptidase [Adhaeribacter aquaticus]|uniref:M56 family metallopeptidase n=1 Tax=Adhaeribacter aquaticus TaxID=299567 RepID=UPI00047DC91D|nr:M56 family metallopeptidase [Adhaeribacter aquaticus]